MNQVVYQSLFSRETEPLERDLLRWVDWNDYRDWEVPQTISGNGEPGKPVV